MQDLATKVAFAANPVELGVADVPPDKFMVFDEYAVVPPLPFKLAKDTKIPSTAD